MHKINKIQMMGKSKDQMARIHQQINYKGKNKKNKREIC